MEKPLARLTPAMQAQFIARSFREWCARQPKRIPAAVRDRALEDILGRRVGDTTPCVDGLAFLAIGYEEFEGAVARARKGVQHRPR